MKLWGITNTGLVRRENQDAYAAFEAGGCTAAVVCDGMGGTHGGRVASAIAVACFQKEIQTDLRADMTADQLRHVMLAAIADANDAIRREAEHNADYRHMGTTLVCALARPDMRSSPTLATAAPTISPRRASARSPATTRWWRTWWPRATSRPRRPDAIPTAT